jgi:signal transduction histidine kinase
MRDRNSERLGAATGLIVAIAVAVPVLPGLATGDGDLIDGPRWLWWVAYAVFLTALTIDTATAGPRADPARTRTLLAVEVAAACVVYLAAPGYGWAAVLFVVTAAAGAYTLAAPHNTMQVIAQSALIGAAQAADGTGVGDALVAAVVYGGFQAFAVLVVRSEQSEAAARAELAAVNVELRATSALLSESTQTAERLRIARELHDVVGHQLTALSLELEVATHHTDGEALTHVRRARDTARAVLGDMRTAVGDLRAPDARLVDPLREMVDDLPGPVIALEVVEDAAVDSEQAVTIVRCVQELITNTLRHADAERLWISVCTAPDGATVSARDDGRGAAVIRHGNGLTGMCERLEALGGTLEIDSRPGRGFHVTVQIPARPASRT